MDRSREPTQRVATSARALLVTIPCGQRLAIDDECKACGKAGGVGVYMRRRDDQSAVKVRGDVLYDVHVTCSECGLDAIDPAPQTIAET